MRAALSTTAVVAASLLAACAPGGGHASGAMIASIASASPTPIASASATTSATTSAAVSAIASAIVPTNTEIARRHAPLYRFNAYVPGPDTSPSNESEDFFPMSAKEFFAELASGDTRVAVTRAKGATPGTNATRHTTGPVSVTATEIDGTPQWLSGNAPGDAPVYAHVYEDQTLRVRNADGSGEDTVYVEYWLFYGQDASAERLSFIGPVFGVGGHRGDWERVMLAVAIELGPSGAFLTTEVRRGFFDAHGKKASVELADLELADDQGAQAAGAAHPVVYVAVGKHASYPEPGAWRDPLGLLPLVVHDEYFRGNGFVWSSWLSPVLDLDGPSSDEFAPATFESLLAPAVRSTGLVDWRDYRGKWGPDKQLTLPVIGTLPLGDSPEGPEAHATYGDGARDAKPWATIKLQATGLTLGASPPVTPVPVPLRLP